MNTYPGIITSRRTRRNLRHFRLLPINPPTESAVQFRAARALNQLSSHASLLVGKWRHCRNSTNYQHHIWRPEKISNSVTLFAVHPIIIISVSKSCWYRHNLVSSSISDFAQIPLNQSEPPSKMPLSISSQSVLALVWLYIKWNFFRFRPLPMATLFLLRVLWSNYLWETWSYVKWFVIWSISLCGFFLHPNQQVMYLCGILH